MEGSFRYNIPAGGFLVIWMDKLNTGLHANFRTRSNDELIFLSNSNGDLLDSTCKENVSQCVVWPNPDGAANWDLFPNPTRGVKNAGDIVSECSTEPVFSLPGGRFGSSQTLTLTNPGTSGKIYYTTDGSDPGLNSNLYTAPITVIPTHTIKARIIVVGKGIWPNGYKYFLSGSTTSPFRLFRFPRIRQTCGILLKEFILKELTG